MASQQAFPTTSQQTYPVPAPAGSTPQAGLVLVVSGGRGEVIIEARSVVAVTNTLSVEVVS